MAMHGFNQLKIMNNQLIMKQPWMGMECEMQST